MPVTLLPGDVLLYGATSLSDLVVSLKTWSKAVHCELYIGDNQCIASRPGKGTDIYQIKPGYIEVRRPSVSFNLDRIVTEFNTNLRHKKYDWVGLLSFLLPRNTVGSKNKYTCSELVAELFKRAGSPLFATDYPLIKIAPAQYQQAWTLYPVK